MSDPKEVLGQLLSPAQADTLDITGREAWAAAANALRALQGAEPAFAVSSARLVMPDEITGEFDAPHLTIPVELSTNQDQEATAYLAFETAPAAAYLGSQADNPDDEEQQTLVIASTVLGQVVQALNSQVFAASSAGLILAIDDITANTMGAILADLDDPCLALSGTVEGQSELAITLVLPGTFLDIMAGAMAVAAIEEDSRTVTTGPLLTQEDLEAAELLDELDLEPQPQPAPVREPVLASVGGGPEEVRLPPPPAPSAPLPSREPTPITPAAQRARFAPLPDPASSGQPKNIDLLSRLQMNVSVELGRTELTVAEVLGLGPGSVIELDRLAGEPVDIMVNDRLIARGEVVVVDENFGVRVVEVVRRTADAEEQAG